MPGISSRSFSIIIPALNRASSVDTAVEVVLSQAREAGEVLVVDDGSRKRTAGEVARFRKAVSYVRDASGGPIAALNRAVARAKGDWVAFLDPKDQWPEDRLGVFAQVMQASKESALFYFSDVDLPVEEGGGHRWEACELQFAGAFRFREDTAPWLFPECLPAMLRSSLIRRDAFGRVGGLSESMGSTAGATLLGRLMLTGPACAVAGCAVNADWGRGPYTGLGAVCGADPRGERELTLLYRKLLEGIPDSHDARHRLLTARLVQARRALRGRTGSTKINRFMRALGRGRQPA